MVKPFDAQLMPFRQTVVAVIEIGGGITGMAQCTCDNGWVRDAERPQKVQCGICKGTGQVPDNPAPQNGKPKK